MLEKHPVSELQNYQKLLAEVKPDRPVFLTQNGAVKYAIINIETDDRYQAGLKLLDQLEKAEKGPFKDFDSVTKALLNNKL